MDPYSHSIHTVTVSIQSQYPYSVSIHTVTVSIQSRYPFSMVVWVCEAGCLNKRVGVRTASQVQASVCFCLRMYGYAQASSTAAHGKASTLSSQNDGAHVSHMMCYVWFGWGSDQHVTQSTYPFSRGTTRDLRSAGSFAFRCCTISLRLKRGLK